MKTLQSIYLLTILTLAVLMCGCQSTESEKKWSFEDNNIGSVPKGWKATETRGSGSAATWEVVSDGCKSKKAVAITENKNSGHTYNLLIATETNYKDLEVGVMVKSGTGKQDQGGGPIWRVKDADNYYIARWNPLEDNFRVYKVVAGRRSQLGSATLTVDRAAWHTLRVTMAGDQITCYLDGTKHLETRDATFGNAGRIGLWTKADAKTNFDDLTVSAPR
jgi:hypothetical protein